MANIHRNQYDPWIDGRESVAVDYINIKNPATGKFIARCGVASRDTVDAVVKRAETVFKEGAWSRMAPADRASIMSKIAQKLSEKVSDLAYLESMQTGRPLREMKIQLSRLPEWFEYHGALARTEEGSVQPTRGKLHNYVKREPLGVVALITSFNHPMLISVKKLAPALAAGNSVIIKPSELAPLTVIHLAQLTKDAGLPDGVLSVLPGYGLETGKALVTNPIIKKVDVTGGTPGGRAIGSIVGGNLASFTAELGGKAPVIIFENTDIDLAVNGVAFASFIASGQTCVAGTRIIVQKAIYPTFVSRLVDKAKSIERRIGSPFDPASMMGPVISQQQLDVISDLVEDARESQGIQILTGGQRMMGLSTLDDSDLSEGFFYPPTVLAPNAKSQAPVPALTDLRLWKEEAFGPVICVVPFDTEAEAIALANDSQYGLGGAVWTRDGAQSIRVAEALEVGIVWVNTHHRNDPSSSWGGVKSSGVGRENGKEAYNSYTRTKSTIINYATEEECKELDDWFREGAGSVRYG